MPAANLQANLKSNGKNYLLKQQAEEIRSYESCFMILGKYF